MHKNLPVTAPQAIQGKFATKDWSFISMWVRDENILTSVPANKNRLIQ